MSDEMMAEQSAPVAEAQTPAATPENVAPLPVDTEALEGDKAQADEKTFTQDELNEIIKKEKARAEARAERRALRAYAEKLERMVPTQQKQPEAAAETGRPTRAQFADDDDYVEAMADWKLSQRDQAQQQQRQQQQAQSMATKTESIYVEAGKVPGFDREAFDELPLTKTIAEALIESDAPEKLMVFMAAHPEDVERIAAMSPARQAAEIGKLEARLASVPKVSSAPAPIKPIGSRGSASNSDPSKMSMEEYAEFRKKNGASWAR